MEKDLPIKVGGLYKTQDSIQCINLKKNIIDFVIQKNELVTIIGITSSLTTDMVVVGLYSNNKIGYWYFRRESWTHKLLSKHELLKEIIDEP